MGYCINQVDSSFFIAVDDVAAATSAVTSMPGGFAFTAHRMGGSPSASQSLEEAMKDWRYEVRRDDVGNIVTIEFIGEKVGDENELFGVIAPFVREGSFIEFSGEDGDRWRHVFDGQDCREVRPTVQWE